MHADRVLQQLRRDVRAAVQALDEHLYAILSQCAHACGCDIVRRFQFVDRMSSSAAGADAWLGARWNDSMAGATCLVLQQHLYAALR
jgi:hypothetical protein